MRVPNSEREKPAIPDSEAPEQYDLAWLKYLAFYRFAIMPKREKGEGGGWIDLLQQGRKNPWITGEIKFPAIKPELLAKDQTAKLTVYEPGQALLALHHDVSTVAKNPDMSLEVALSKERSWVVHVIETLWTMHGEVIALKELADFRPKRNESVDQQVQDVQASIKADLAQLADEYANKERSAPFPITMESVRMSPTFIALMRGYVDSLHDDFEVIRTTVFTDKKGREYRIGFSPHDVRFLSWFEGKLEQEIQRPLQQLPLNFQS